MYGNGKEAENSIDNILKNLLTFHPEWYEKSQRTPVVTEMITHVGTRNYHKEKVPCGIDPKYFEGRKAELNLSLIHI